jgi:ABC-type branched-subunit amino acid transport system substrate-binding protein
MRLRTGLVALVSATVCGCGSTVSGAGQSSSGLSGPQTTSSAANGLAAPGSVGSGGSSSAGSTGSTGAGAQSTVGAGPGTSTTTSGRGASTIADHAPIEVGIGVDGNNGPFAAAFGVSNSQPSEQAVAAAVVAYLNRQGGLAGHPIHPVYAVFDNTSNDWVSQDQAMCAKFTQDHRVTAVVRTDDIFGPLDACLAKAGTPLVLWESVFRPRAWWDAAPGLRFTPDEATGARTYAALADRMVATGRWKPSTRIGLVRYDRADQAQVQSQGVEPALAAHGLKLTDSEAVHTPESFQDIGTTSSDLAGAVLRMRQKGITSVVFMGGDVAYLFAQEATSQRYYPAYALTSFDFPNLLPASALGGAFGIGWDPSDDLTTQTATTPGMKRCQQAVAGIGVTWSATGADRSYTTCDQLFFLKSAYDAAGSVGPGALAEGARRVGPGMAPSLTFRVDSSRHPDGLAAYRDLSFVASCSCLRYGSLFAVGS